LQDLAAHTGGRFISVDAGEKVENAQIADLGRCRLVWASRDFFSIVDGVPDQEAVAERVRLIRARLDEEDIPFEREQLRQRLGRLTGGVAVLSVGAATRTEMTERKARAERAIKAVEAARRDGVVPGGGVALINCARAIDTKDPALSLDERMGRLAVVRALEAPLRTIVQNAGAEPEPVVDVVKRDSGRTGYDAVQGCIADVYDSGILDPFNVVRAALRNGVSAAVMVMMTEALVIPRFRMLHVDPKP
jgi:chaperonin GroEL